MGTIISFHGCGKPIIILDLAVNQILGFIKELRCNRVALTRHNAGLIGMSSVSQLSRCFYGRCESQLQGLMAYSHKKTRSVIVDVKSDSNATEAVEQALQLAHEKDVFEGMNDERPVPMEIYSQVLTKNSSTQPRSYRPRCWISHKLRQH